MRGCIDAHLLADTRQLSDKYRESDGRPAALVFKRVPDLGMGGGRCTNPYGNDVSYEMSASATSILGSMSLTKVCNDVDCKHRVLPIWERFGTVDVCTIRKEHGTNRKKCTVPIREGVSLVVDEDDCLNQAADKEDSHGITGLPGTG